MAEEEKDTEAAEGAEAPEGDAPTEAEAAAEDEAAAEPETAAEESSEEASADAEGGDAPAAEAGDDEAAGEGDEEAEAPKPKGPPPGPPRSREERNAEREARRRARAGIRRSWRRRVRERRRQQAADRTVQPPAPKEHGPGRPKVRQGVVVSNKAAKTVTVRIDVTRQHRAYKKTIRESSTLHAHDEREEAQEGDVVRLVESRPMSRTKRWRLVEVLERAPR